MLFVCVPRYQWIGRCISSHQISFGNQAAWITTLTFQTSIEPRFEASARAAPGPAPVAILADSRDLVEDCQAKLTCQRKLPPRESSRIYPGGQTYLDAFLIYVDVRFSYRYNRFDKALGPPSRFHASKCTLRP